MAHFLKKNNGDPFYKRLASALEPEGEVILEIGSQAHSLRMANLIWSRKKFAMITLYEILDMRSSFE